MHVNDLLKLAVEAKASDLHLKVGSYPMMRVRGVTGPGHRGEAARSRGHRQHGGGRDVHAAAPEVQGQPSRSTWPTACRASAASAATSSSSAARSAWSCASSRSASKTVDDLGLPQVLKTIAEEERGLVLVTGTTGSGKSTSLAALVDHVNATRCAHVVTVEDPIEFLHRDNRSIVNQREVAVDTRSFAHALRSALRQDPDVILVGEMRDYETIETALLAAETGHLVFSTLHTLDATETINRIIAVFPPHQQKQIRMQLASVLKARHLAAPAAPRRRPGPRRRGRGHDHHAVHPRLHRGQGKDAPDPRAIAAGTSQYGMQTFDQAIFGLYEQKMVTYDEALRWASNKDEFKLKVQGISTTADETRDQMARSAASVRAGDAVRQMQARAKARLRLGLGHCRS